MRLPLKTLQELVEVVSLVPEIRSIPSSQAIQIKMTGKELRLSLRGYLTSEAWAPCVTDRGSICVDRRVLRGFAETARGKEIELTMTPKQLLLRSGRQRAKLSGIAEGGYEPWSQKGKAVKLPSWALAQLPTLGFYGQSVATAENLAGVALVHDWGILATDGLAAMATLAKDIPASCVLPPSLCKLAAELKNCRLRIGVRGIGVLLDNGYLYEGYLAAADKYPLTKMQSIIGRVGTTKPSAAIKTKVFAEELALFSHLATGGKQAILALTIKGGTARFLLGEDRAEIERSRPTSDGQYEGRWAIRYVEPFVKLCLKCGIETLQLGRLEHMTFWYGGKARRVILVVVDVL